jgi:hypothetical protein
LQHRVLHDVERILGVAHGDLRHSQRAPLDFRQEPVELSGSIQNLPLLPLALFADGNGPGRPMGLAKAAGSVADTGILTVDDGSGLRV